MVLQGAGGVDIAATGIATTIKGTFNVDEAVTFDTTVGVSGALTMDTDKKIQFRDTALFINSSADGQLDIDADTTLQITAPTVDIDASTEVNISNALTVGGNISGTIATATQNSITTMTGLTSTGALASGSIANGFGTINIGVAFSPRIYLLPKSSINLQLKFPEIILNVYAGSRNDLLLRLLEGKIDLFVSAIVPEDIKIIEETLKKNSPETEDLVEILKIFKDYNFNNFEFDPSVIRGLEYYTGVIFEVNLKFDVTNNKGQVIQFGSIGGGGRYDNLVNNFGNYDAPATGISIGLDRLVYALMQKKEFKIKKIKPVVICVFDKNSMKDYINVLTILREAGVSTEIYPGISKLKKQMEYANKIKSPAVILYGENEIKSGKPTLRNLSSGEEKSIEIKELVNEIKKII